MDIESLGKIFDMHLKECEGRDSRNMEAIKEIKGMFKGMWDAQDRMEAKITNLYVRGAFALGGLVVVGKLLDYFFAMQHK